MNKTSFKVDTHSTLYLSIITQHLAVSKCFIIVELVNGNYVIWISSSKQVYHWLSEGLHSLLLPEIPLQSSSINEVGMTYHWWVIYVMRLNFYLLIHIHIHTLRAMFWVAQALTLIWANKEMEICVLLDHFRSWDSFSVSRILSRCSGCSWYLNYCLKEERVRFPPHTHTLCVVNSLSPVVGFLIY